MPANEIKITRLLRAAYESCREGEIRYRLAFEGESDPDLKCLFNSYALQRERFGRQLREELVAAGWQQLTVGAGGNVVPHPFRPDRTSGSILGECARGEEEVRLCYQKVLAAELPDPIRALLERQLREVEAVSVRIRQLQELAQPTLKRSIGG